MTWSKPAHSFANIGHGLERKANPRGYVYGNEKECDASAVRGVGTVIYIGFRGIAEHFPSVL